MKRALPVGTLVVLKKPLTGDIGVTNLGDKSYSVGRIAEVEQTGEHGITFEGLNTGEGNPLVLYFDRDEFVLARPGT